MISDGSINKYRSVGSELMCGKDAEDSILISFVIPTFNRPDTLFDTIDSIRDNIKKELINYEVIIVDNSAIVKNNVSLNLFKERSYSSNYKYYVNQQNIGMEGNWNRCFELARGTFVAMIHDDDLIANNYFINLFKTLEKFENNFERIGFIKTNILFFREKEQIVEKNETGSGTLKRIQYFDMLLSGNGFTQTPTCGILFNKNAILEAGGFNEELHPSADAIMGAILINNKYECYASGEITGYYRIAMNESLKVETIRQFIKNDCLIREYIYSLHWIGRLFKRFFSSFQYSIHLEQTIVNYNTNFGLSIGIKDIDYWNAYKKMKQKDYFVYKIATTFINIIKRL